MLKLSIIDVHFNAKEGALKALKYDTFIQVMFGGNIYRTNTRFGVGSYTTLRENFYFSQSECQEEDSFILECYDEHDTRADFLGSTDPMPIGPILSNI